MPNNNPLARVYANNLTMRDLSGFMLGFGITRIVLVILLEMIASEPNYEYMFSNVIMGLLIAYLGYLIRKTTTSIRSDLEDLMAFRD